jgi:nucleotide-binding universal stress UspA family protein
MGRYNKLIVAVDGSEASKNALRQSFKLAFDEKKWITAVAIDPPYQGDLELVGVSNIKDMLKGKGRQILEEARKIAEDEKASIKTRLEEGEPFEKIVEIAEEENCELIVMGRRGLSGLERTLMGSVTAKVIGHFKGRTLVVPEDTSIGWQNILLAYDGSKYSEEALSEAINYARSYEGSLKIVNVLYTNDEFIANAPDIVEKMVEKAKENLESARKKALQEGVETETFVREGEPYAVITSIAEELKSDTIIMGSKGKTQLGRILMGSVTSRVIGYAPCPIMVINR